MEEKEELNKPEGEPKSCCTPGSGQADCCCGSECSKSVKTIIFLAVILLACVVAGRSLLTRRNEAASVNLPVLSDTRAADKEAVLVLLTDGSGGEAQDVLQQMEQAAGKIAAKGTSIVAFGIDSKSDDYALLSGKLSIDSFPSVVVLVKGRGISIVSGQITEARLLEAFLQASTPGSCCPANGPSCCPR